MSFRKNLLGKVARKFFAALTIPPLFLRYCLYVLSLRKVPPQSLHEFSQLLLLSPWVGRCHGMTAATEQAYFQWYAKHLYTGIGDIVDLGCWLGSTTIPLAMGLTENVNSKASLGYIHAYDNFIWADYMNAGVVGTPLEGRYRTGESFLEAFDERTAPWKDRIKAHPGDLRQIGWDGGKIEF